MALRSMHQWLLLLALLMAAAFSGCGGESEPEIPPQDRPPSITQGPQHVAVPLGGNAVFTVIAAGVDVSYQWQRSNDAGASFASIAGATADSYTLNAVQASDGGARFRVRVFNRNGDATSLSALLTVLILGPPTITQQPLDVTARVGTDARFDVVVSGAGLAYVWQRSNDGGLNFADIANAPGASYTLASVAVGDQGARFRVRVSNSEGTVLSNVATLTVTTTSLYSIADQTFAVSDWTVAANQVGGSSLGVAQLLNGGNPDAFRRVTLNLGTLPGGPPEIISFHGRRGAEYTPRTGGAIGTISVRLDVQYISLTGSGVYQGSAVILQQATPQGVTNVYQGPRHAAGPQDQMWYRSAFTLAADGFHLIRPDRTIDPQAHPDFSASGGLIQFGFLVAASDSVVSASTIVIGIDNWEVTVNP